MKHTPVKLAIIGGGAAGMFAAAVASERRIPCIVFERKARLGAKVLMTANGRCNFTKDISVREFVRDLGEPVGRWCEPALTRCPPQRIMTGFRHFGVKIRTTPDRRVFPGTMEASTVVHALGDALRDNNVPICTNCAVTGIQPIKQGFIVGTDNFTITAENVLITTGGVSFPKTGSVGDGQKFARDTGHVVTPYRAGLVGFETDDPQVVRKAGARFERAYAKVIDANGRVLFEHRGEVDCERWGLGGAAVYNCSRYIAHNPIKGEWTLEAGLDRGHVTLRNPEPRPVKEAIVTVGGVSLDDVDPETMMSRKVPGMYFAGEVLDIDGPTGGYNLTLAFATAFTAIERIGK